MQATPIVAELDLLNMPGWHEVATKRVMLGIDLLSHTCHIAEYATTGP